MTTNASRAPVDFDAFERGLQPSLPEATASASSPLAAASPYDTAKPDPLAELARIVGQDDPFRALLEARGTARPANRIEPSLEEAALPERHEAATSPADAFDRYLASVEQSHQEGAHLDPAAFAPVPREARSLRPHGRRKLVQVGAGLGVLALCVTGALAWRGVSGSTGGSGPVTVLADKSPLKIAPEKADGVDIPDQNKQIYERNAKDSQIKVVNREEQPLDVTQAARALNRENGAQSAAPGGTTPGGLLTDSLGEPRRIRTVAVKPDTPPPALSQPAPQPNATATPEHASEARHAPISPIPTMTLPDDGESTATPVSLPPKPAASARIAKPVTTPAAAPIVEASAAEEPAAKPVPPRRTPRRVASVAPEAGLPAAEPETTAAPAVTAAVGGFAVQLGVRNSESDARSALQQMQAKHSQLSGKPALIRQAELNGKSFYRVRVGPLGKAEATSLCASLKDAGTACFVAAN